MSNIAYLLARSRAAKNPANKIVGGAIRVGTPKAQQRHSEVMRAVNKDRSYEELERRNAIPVWTDVSGKPVPDVLPPNPETISAWRRGSIVPGQFHTAPSVTNPMPPKILAAYRTFESIGVDYGVNRSTIHRIVEWVEADEFLGVNSSNDKEGRRGQKNNRGGGDLCINPGYSRYSTIILFPVFNSSAVRCVTFPVQCRFFRAVFYPPLSSLSATLLIIPQINLHR
jgi:hypothetical protein